MANVGGVSASSPAPPAEKGFSGAAFLGLVVAGAALLGLALWAAKKEWSTGSRRSECEARLRYIGMTASVYHAKYKAWPAETGPEFWQVVLKADGPPLGRAYDFTHCPVTGKAYRGPGKTPTDADPWAWLGCCEPGTHGDDTLAVNGAGNFEVAPRDDARFLGTRP